MSNHINVPNNPENERRIEIAYRLGRPDKVPVDFGMADQCNFLSGWLGMNCRDYHLDPEIMLGAQIAFRQRFNGLGIIGPNYGAVVEPSIFGARIMFTKENPPWAIPAIDNVDMLCEYLDGLVAPDPVFAGLLPLVYQCYFYMREKVGEQVSPPLGVLGPWDTAAQLIGIGNLCMATKLYPDLVHALLSRITETLLDVTEVKIEKLRATTVTILVAEDMVSSLSPEAFREFVIPYTGRIFKDIGASVNLWHCDGQLKHLLELVPELGATVLISFDPHTDLEIFKAAIGDKVALSGNIAPLSVLRNGTTAEIRAEVKRQIDIGKRNGGYLLDTGGELANGTPPENIDAMLEAAEEFGG